MKYWFCIVIFIFLGCKSKSENLAEERSENILAKITNRTKVAKVFKGVCYIDSLSVLKCTSDEYIVPELPNIVSLDSFIGGAGWHRGSGMCALDVNGQARCWRGETAEEVDLPSLPPLIQIAIGMEDICSIDINNNLKCWNIETGVDVSLPSLAGLLFTHVSSSVYGGCALDTHQNVHCWGGTIHGEANVPSDLEPSIQVETALFISCSLGVTGNVRCWGGHQNGMEPRRDIFPPASLSNLNVVKISVGTGHACALIDNGEVKCWGGTLMIGYIQPFGTPSFQSISDVASTSNTSCIDLPDRVHCWGRYRGRDYIK